MPEQRVHISIGIYTDAEDDIRGPSIAPPLPSARRPGTASGDGGRGEKVDNRCRGRVDKLGAHADACACACITRSSTSSRCRAISACSP